jgi:hypothetical protein
MNVRKSSGTLLAGAAALLVALLSAPAGAQTPVNTTLDTLLSGGSNQNGIVLGDKRYSNFTFSSSGDAPITANNVDVNLSTADSNRYQLRFSFARDALDSTAGQTTDAVICYQVTVLGNQQINSVGLVFDSSVGQGSPGLAAASVTESISRVAQGAEDVGQLTVFNDGTGGLPDSSNSTLAVNPAASTLYFCKDIIASSRPEGGRVVISTVDNFVNQVPEPATFGVLAAATGLLLVRRRRA